jgi:hypothetical protein
MAGSGSSGASGTDERTIAIWYANKLLDEPHCDPDDDLRTLARQFLRCIETLDELKKRSAVETTEELDCSQPGGICDTHSYCTSVRRCTAKDSKRSAVNTRTALTQPAVGAAQACALCGGTRQVPCNWTADRTNACPNCTDFR